MEFALLVPVLLLILLFAIDFGRAFYSWVILQNASRIGANFAGLNAQAWEVNPDDAVIVAEYQALVADDIDEALCTNPVVPDPVFTDSTGDTSTVGQTPDSSYNVGDSAKVELTCVFHPLTPVVSAIVSTNVTLGASSEFRIRAGQIAGLDDAPPIPRPSVASPTPVPPPPSAPAPSSSAASCSVNANFTRSPSAGSMDAGTDVTFTNTSSASGCTITSFAWNFATGVPSTATGAGPHTVDFPTPGNVTVSLTVTTNTGATDVQTTNFRLR